MLSRRRDWNGERWRKSCRSGKFDRKHSVTAAEPRCSKLALAEYENQNLGTQPTAKGTPLEAKTTTSNEDLAQANAVICPTCASRFTNAQTTFLFSEFQGALVEKEGRIARLENEADVQSAELHTERELVQKAVTEKEEMRRNLNVIKADDESASKVVERYM